jgi:glycosyltransferase involved in cell wall biosynthesis
MNVLLVTSSYPKFPGDVTAPFIESIAEAVAARGHGVDVVLPHHPALRRPPGPIRFFPYHYAPLDSWHSWGYASSLERDIRLKPRVLALAPLVALSLRRLVSSRLKTRRYDVVHAHWVLPNAALVHDLVRGHGVPLVVSLHGSDVFLAERHRWLGSFAAAAFRSAGAISACSGDLRRRSLALGADPARTRTVSYGVDPAAFAPGDGAAFRARFGIPGAAPLVLGVGRLVEKKGFRFLLEAAEQVEALHLLLAGDGDLRRALAEQARGLETRAIVAGALDRDAVRAAYAAADVVAVPSVKDRAGNVDGLPNVLLEALAAGCAVVASRIAGIPDVVEDGRNGVLVPPGDAAALAEALRRLVGDPALRKRLGAEARRRASAELRWEQVAEAFEGLYAQAAALDAR